MIFIITFILTIIGIIILAVWGLLTFLAVTKPNDKNLDTIRKINQIIILIIITAIFGFLGSSFFD